MYTAVVLDDKSHDMLISYFSDVIPEGWENIAHHMTINMGPIEKEFEKYLGMRNVPLKVTHLGIDELVMAVRVDCEVPTKNDIPHITLAVDRQNGGKPFLSNKITDWKPITFSLELFGTVEEVGK